MLVSTEAISLNYVKYSETSIIVKCFTKSDGLKSYLLKVIRTSKKKKINIGFFQPLTQLEIDANHRNNGGLEGIRVVKIINPYKTIHLDIIKNCIVMFLSEVLSKSIKEEEKNLPLFDYLETGLTWLDLHDKIANFHLLFLLNLSRFLGFYPDLSEKDKLGFDLVEGSFTNITSQKNVIVGNNFFQFKKLLGINFDKIENVSFNKHERQVVLKIIIRYFELHLDGFKKPKSLQILETVFS